MDVKRFRDGLKQDIKAELRPRKLLRTALVPQTKGLLVPIKEVFQVFVSLIAQIFVQSKLISKDHPSVKGEVHGFGAIWLMIIDASSNVKFKRENIYQIVVFYGIVGMLVFGVLDLAAFLMHLSLGHAHAATTPDSSTLFTESNLQDNGPSWLNTMFPVANGQTAKAATLPYALQDMLITYNTALLALAMVLALWQIAHLFMESAHYGKFGGNRYSQLYAPLRLVIGIGLLVPLGTGFNSAQLIAIEMAKMGSGLASNVWMSTQEGLKGLNTNPTVAPVGDVDTILEKLVVDETCLAGMIGAGASVSTTPPTWSQYLIEQTPTGQNFGDDTSSSATSFSITFDSAVGKHDGYCGTIVIPANQSAAGNSDPSIVVKPMNHVNYIEQAYIQHILTDVWNISAQIYNTSLGGVDTSAPGGSDPNQNPFTSKTWTSFVGHPGTITTSANTASGCGAQATESAAGTGETAYIETQTVALFNDYQSTIACAAAANANPDWTKAGFMFLMLAQRAGDLYSLQTPTVTVGLPNSEIMYVISAVDPGCHWYSGIFSDSSYQCAAAGQNTADAIGLAAKFVKAGVQGANKAPYEFAPNSSGSGNDGGKLQSAIAQPTVSLINQIQAANGAAYNAPATQYQFGDSIMHIMAIGNIITITDALLFVVSAAIGSTIFGIVAGIILMVFGAALWPIGIALSIMVPLLPAARFIFGIFAWILTLFEAIVAMPVVALVMIRSDGEGLFAHGNAGWFFLLQMMLRPVLMIFGLLGAVLVFDTLSGFITQTVFGVWFGLLGTGTVSGTISAMLGIIGFLYFYVFTIYSCANLSFQLINQIPDRILSWIGAQSLIASDQTDHVIGESKSAASTTMKAGAIASGGAAGAMLGMPSGNGSGGGAPSNANLISDGSSGSSGSGVGGGAGSAIGVGSSGSSGGRSGGGGGSPSRIGSAIQNAGQGIESAFPLLSNMARGASKALNDDAGKMAMMSGNERNMPDFEAKSGEKDPLSPLDRPPADSKK